MGRDEILGPRDIPRCCTFWSVWGKVKIIYCESEASDYDQLQYFPSSQPSWWSYSDSPQGWRWADRWQSLRCSPSPPTPTGTSSSCPPPPGCNQIKFDGQLPMAWLDQKCPRFYQKSKTGFDLFAKKVLTCPGCHSGLAVSSSDALNSHSWVEANVVFFDFTKMF